MHKKIKPNLNVSIRQHFLPEITSEVNDRSKISGRKLVYKQKIEPSKNNTSNNIILYVFLVCFNIILFTPFTYIIIFLNILIYSQFWEL